VLSKRAQLVGPKRLNLIKPGPQSHKGLSPQPVDTNPSIPVAADDLDEPTSAQHPKVPAHSRPRHVDGVGKLPSPPRPNPQHVDNPPPRGIGERRQHPVQILTHARNY
jgi:hypothetical protein